MEASLRQAKLATYAAQGDDASVAPLRGGSKQLEYRDGDWLDRDIYFGTIRFVGQEVVYHADKSIWSMAYSGGVVQGLVTSEVRALYAFLRSALLQAPADMPLRGPPTLVDGAHTYNCSVRGTLTNFTGHESITAGGREVYALQLSGGRLA